MDRMQTPKERAVAEVALAQSRVVRLHQLRQLQVTRGQRRAHVSAGRWRSLPYRGVIVDRGPLEGTSAWWKALTEVSNSARLGGVTALQAAGLTGFREPVLHVWVTKSTHKGAPAGVRVHETRRWGAEDVCAAGIPRSRPDVATVQAALWAQSPRQALLALVMPVQQRLVRPVEVATVLERVRRHRFRRLLLTAIGDVMNGAQSLGELDFARKCRARGLPEPTRQLVQRTSQGRVYLDVYWEPYGVALEINGVGHLRVDQVMRDDVRAIDLQASGDAALSVSLFTLRCESDAFFSRLGQLLRSRGWRG